jgi:hypothetical protein
MKKILTLTSLLALTSCSMYSTGMSGGLIGTGRDKAYYTQVDNTVKAKKEGQSCAYNVLWLVSWGDSSIDAAKKDGNIEKVANVDRELFQVGYFYSKGCTIIQGE